MSLFRENASSSTMRRHRTTALKKQKGRCFFCKKPLQKRYATADHLLARSRGGKDSAKNIVAACFGCNQSKGSKIYGEDGGKPAREVHGLQGLLPEQLFFR